MRWAVQGAVRTIYQRELRRLVEKAEEKADDAHASVKAILTFMASWKASYEEQGLEVDAGVVQRVREVLETARADLPALLEELPRASRRNGDERGQRCMITRMTGQRA